MEGGNQKSEAFRMIRRILLGAVGFLLLSGVVLAAQPEVTTLCRFVDPESGLPVVGAVLENDQILPLQALYAQLNDGKEQPRLTSILAFFDGDESEAKILLNELVLEAEGKNFPLLDAEEVILLAPVDPVKLIAGSIFEGHATEGRRAWARELMPVQWAIATMIGGGPFSPPEEHYEEVTYYQGNHLDWVPHRAAIVLPEGWDSVDFEIEIAMLVVKQGGLFQVGGYFLFDDVTHRKTQGIEIDKVKHGFSASKHVNAAGWKFVLAEYVDFSKIEAAASVRRADGTTEELCRGNTTDSLFSPEEVLQSIARRDGGLHVGQVITTGTITGCCGLEIKGAADADMLYPDDTIRFESGLLGTLENPIRK